MFSIIIPVYNSEKHIGKCILSVLSQTLQDFEIIAVNDGSSDSTGIILNRFAEQDSRIKVIHQTNQGPLIARQTGISVARGQYILSLDSDDYFDSNLLETVNQYSRQGYDMILFRWHYRKSEHHCRNSKTLFPHETVFTKEGKKKIYDKLIKTHDLNMIWAKAFKRSMFTPQMFDLKDYCGFKYGEDLIMSIPLLLKAESIIYLDIPLYNYIDNDESITRNLGVSYFQSRKIINKALEEFLRRADINTEENRSIIETRFLSDIVIGIPKSAQIQKTGGAVVDEYLRSIACDKIFRNKWEKQGTKGLGMLARAKLYLLYHYHCRCVRALSWLQTPVASLKLLLRSLGK